jgi:hypothetical protein
MVSKAKGERFKIIMENTAQMIKVIQILFRHILNGRIKLREKHIKKLKPHKKFIRRIASGSHKTIKPVVQKGGSILQAILRTVLPLLPALL